MQERQFQAELIKKLREMLPGCIILKNDSSYMQGVPDLILLYEDHWAMLEVKKSAKAPFRPNQEYYLGVLNEMSFAASIFPENEDEVLSDLQHAFAPRRSARVSKR